MCFLQVDLTLYIRFFCFPQHLARPQTQHYTVLLSFNWLCIAFYNVPLEIIPLYLIVPLPKLYDGGNHVKMLHRSVKIT